VSIYEGRGFVSVVEGTWPTPKAGRGLCCMWGLPEQSLADTKLFFREGRDGGVACPRGLGLYLRVLHASVTRLLRPAALVSRSEWCQRKGKHAGR
jgi:hypothetical protein